MAPVFSLQVKSAFAMKKELKANGSLKIKLTPLSKVKKVKKASKSQKSLPRSSTPNKASKKKTPTQAHSKKAKALSSSKILFEETYSKDTPGNISKPTDNKKSLKRSKKKKPGKNKYPRHIHNAMKSSIQPGGERSPKQTTVKNSPKLTPGKKSPKLTNGKKSPKLTPGKKSPKQTPDKKFPKQTPEKKSQNHTPMDKSPNQIPIEKSPGQIGRKKSTQHIFSSNKNVNLTPKSLAVAIEKAATSRTSILITPLKSKEMVTNAQNRKRKTPKPSSKNPKKLKIKLSSEKKNVNRIQEIPKIVMANTEKEFVRKNGHLKNYDMYDSGKESALLFEWMISPVGPNNFFENLWEKKPLLVRRHKPEYFKGLFTTEEFDSILKKNDIQFGTNIDVTTYTDGQRETHNPEGRAHASVVWDYFNNGCSVRLLNPQSYSDKVWKLLSVLQEKFGSFCGANVYLTPAGTQGFAPHYDDIEAFILQLEGKKRWRLYNPRSENEVLPRLSSGNFTDEEIGLPILDTVLEEGDVLYFPRGYIHQATPPSETHSLHLTVSVCQKNTWGDLFGKLLSQSLQAAMEEDVDFRLSLPRDYLHFMGLINSDQEDERRKAFLLRIRDLFGKLASFAPVDEAVDEMAQDLLHSSLPPVLTDEERSCMVYGSKVQFKDGQFVTTSEQITEDTEIQLIRRDVLRLLTRDDEIHVHHCMENTRVYHSKPSQYFIIPQESAPGVEFLVTKYPEFVKVSELPLEGDLQGKELDLATVLFEKGLVRTKHPLLTVTDDGNR